MPRIATYKKELETATPWKEIKESLKNISYNNNVIPEINHRSADDILDDFEDILLDKSKFTEKNLNEEDETIHDGKTNLKRITHSKKKIKQAGKSIPTNKEILLCKKMKSIKSVKF